VTLSIVLLVLFAALLHAGWNALLKGGEDRFWSMTVMCAAIALACIALLPFLPIPHAASWPYIAASAVLHVGYNAFLIRAYRGGDFGGVYPVARGASPLLVTLGAALAAGERPGTAAMLGILLVSLGILSLAWRGRRLPETGIADALGTGVFIALYSVTDGIGARLSGDAAAYAVWMCLGWSVLAVLGWLALRGPATLWRGARTTGLAALGGLVSLLAYGIVIIAMAHAPMGMVSALRETSILFAILLGRIVFGEALTPRRVLAGLMIVAGVLCLGA